MPRVYSIFDTNIYRRLSVDELEDLRQGERSKSVQPTASPWVALELLAQAGAPGGNQVRPCRAALVRLVEHCRTYIGKHFVVPVMATAERQVSYALLGGDATDSTIRAVTSYIEEVITAPKDAPNRFDWWQELNDYVTSSEQALTQNIWTHVIQAALPEAHTWDALVRSPARLKEVLSELDSDDTLRLFARSVLGSSDDQTSPRFSDSDGAIDAVVQRMSKPLSLYRQLVREVLTRGLDLSKDRNRNVVWDIRIALAAVTFSTLDAMPVCLVTDDRVILDAAAASGYRTRILPLSAYRELLMRPSPIDQYLDPAA